jgi:hypothetical protein
VRASWRGRRSPGMNKGCRNQDHESRPYNVGVTDTFKPSTSGDHPHRQSDQATRHPRPGKGAFDIQKFGECIIHQGIPCFSGAVVSPVPASIRSRLTRSVDENNREYSTHCWFSWRRMLQCKRCETFFAARSSHPPRYRLQRPVMRHANRIARSSIGRGCPKLQLR